MVNVVYRVNDRRYVLNNNSKHFRWYPLTCKPGQNKPGYRGELEVKIGFTVRANDTASTAGSVSDLSKKARGSISSLNKVAGNIGGSLLSLGGKEKKNLARLASAVSGKGEKVGITMEIESQTGRVINLAYVCQPVKATA